MMSTHRADQPEAQPMAIDPDPSRLDQQLAGGLVARAVRLAMLGQPGQPTTAEIDEAVPSLLVGAGHRPEALNLALHLIRPLGSGRASETTVASIAAIMLRAALQASQPDNIDAL